MKTFKLSNEDSRKYPRTISMSIGIWNEIDKLAPHGERSSFVEMAVQAYIDQMALKDTNNGG